MSIELPTECLIKIFEFIHHDYATLHSCSLVNRQWGAVAIPMLWEEPLMNLDQCDKIHMPITTYIMCLSDEAKTILSKCDIKITPTLKRRPTFNYASYLRRLDNITLFDAVEMWIKKCNIIPREEQCFIPIFPVYQLLEQLLRNFMKNCDNLIQLRLRKSDRVKCLSDALLELHLLPEAEKSLSRLNEFSFDGCMDPKILFKASVISKNIQHLNIDCVCFDNEGLAKLIQAQQKPLLSLSMETTTNSKLPNIESSLKNKVKSLTSLIIHKIFSLDVFSNCKDLERLIITHRECFGENLMKKFINSDFHKLHELQLQLDHPYLYQISTLIKNTNGNLTSLYLYWITPQDTNNFSLLIITIIMNCPNLTEYLGSYANEVINYYLPLFFEKCSKLEYFYIYDDNSAFYDISKVMKSISKVIPKNLKMMWLSEGWICNIEALNLFLESCEKQLSEPLIFFICNRTRQHDEIIRKYIDKNVLSVQ
uniref:UDP-N-acetylglucosamine--N-acetylmuramyl-(Pentapeptide) pyrophosphoryl-undecaprenol N-acetylglucosamine transferase n=1 Tax=Anthurium amnicola TaxID=1678845 RepID=A0A1D1XR10_9ARAE